MKERDPRKSDIHPIGDEIEHLLKSYRLEDKYNETRLILSWEKVMGKTIAKRTTKIYIREKILHVHISSAPLKHELNLNRSRILSLLFNEFGEAVVKDIKIQ